MPTHTLTASLCIERVYFSVKNKNETELKHKMNETMKMQRSAVHNVS